MRRQSGNVFFIIFLAIALFGALSYVVSNSLRNAGDTGGKEKLDVQVSDVVTYANSLVNAVKILKLNGCGETLLNFENSKISGYINPDAPLDKSCNIFDAAGGGLSYQSPLPSILDARAAALTNYGTYYFSGSQCVWGVGTGNGSNCVDNNSELLVYIPYIKREVCIALNKAFEVNPPNYTPRSDSHAYVKFKNTYGGSTDIKDTFNIGKKAACTTDATYYYFYFTLLAR